MTGEPMSLLSRVKIEASKPRTTTNFDPGLPLAYIDSDGFRWYVTERNSANGVVTSCTREDALDEHFIVWEDLDPKGPLLVLQGTKHERETDCQYDSDDA